MVVDNLLLLLQGLPEANLLNLLSRQLHSVGHRHATFGFNTLFLLLLLPLHVLRAERPLVRLSILPQSHGSLLVSVWLVLLHLKLLINWVRNLSFRMETLSKQLFLCFHFIFVGTGLEIGELSTSLLIVCLLFILVLLLAWVVDLVHTQCHIVMVV